MLRLGCSPARTMSALEELSGFVHSVVVTRRDEGLKAWRQSERGYRLLPLWLVSHFVSHLPFPCAAEGILPRGSGILVELALPVGQFSVVCLGCRFARKQVANVVLVESIFCLVGTNSPPELFFGTAGPRW